MDETTSAAGDRTGNRHLSRRKVLKAAGHAAWVVPAIQIASMAPAFAGSKDNLEIIAAGGQWALGSTDYVDVTITIKNDSPSLPANGVLVTLTFPNVYVRDEDNPPKDKKLSFPIVAGSGWSNPPQVSYPGSKTTRVGKVVFTLSQLAANTPTTLTFRVATTRDMNSVAGGSTDTVNFDVTATGFPKVSSFFDPVLAP